MAGDGDGVAVQVAEDREGREGRVARVVVAGHPGLVVVADRLGLAVVADRLGLVVEHQKDREAADRRVAREVVDLEEDTCPWSPNDSDTASVGRMLVTLELELGIWRDGWVLYSGEVEASSFVEMMVLLGLKLVEFFDC